LGASPVFFGSLLTCVAAMSALSTGFNVDRIWASDNWLNSHLPVVPVGLIATSCLTSENPVIAI
jgi:hypothetical protein